MYRLKQQKSRRPFFIAVWVSWWYNHHSCLIRWTLPLWIVKSGHISHLLFRATPRTRRDMAPGDSPQGDMSLCPSGSAWPLPEEVGEVVFWGDRQDHTHLEGIHGSRGIWRDPWELGGGLTGDLQLSLLPRKRNDHMLSVMQQASHLGPYLIYLLRKPEGKGLLSLFY